MANERIDIDYGQALADAEKIQTIINNIDEAVQTLNNGFTQAKTYTNLKWFTRMGEEWDQFCAGDIPATLEEMKKSKTNIEAAVADMQQYEG
ncbi:MAG: hypothetical protein IKF71_01170 [Bacilli bacterium]|nr:hypothetical protein [Bacilli bacterium]